MPVTIIKGKTSGNVAKTVRTNDDGELVISATNITSLTPPAIVQIKSLPFVSLNSLIRPTGSPAIYTVGDVWGTASNCTLTFTACAPAVGGGGTIVAVSIACSSNAVVGKTFDLHLFNATPSAAIADHVAFSLDMADVLAGKWVGVVPGFNLSTANATDATSHATVECKLPFVCAAASTTLYGRVVVTGAYTSVASETICVQLHILP